MRGTLGFVSLALITVSLAVAAPADPEAEAAWKVDGPHGPTHTVAFTTEEATWLALDLDPTGTKIVFSLLGDLYVLPSTGGKAKSITSGPTGHRSPSPRIEAASRTCGSAI